MYYYTPVSAAEDNTFCAAKESQTSTDLCPPLSSSLPLSDDDSSSPFLSDSPLHTSASPLHQPASVSAPRPLLVFFSWLGAQPGAVAKYRDLYLDRGMDVLWVRSDVMHFLWPRWGMNYGLEVLKVLEEPRFSGRVVLVHASSIGGYSFTQILTHIAQGQKQHAGLAQRVIGQIYDSLVVGSLEHMAIGLGKTLLPRFERLIKNTAMLYFWLFKSQTADLYNTAIQVFNDSPITAPALFFSSDNDVMCEQASMDKVIDRWRRRGVTVECKKWKVSTHAAHMRCHPEDYLCTLEKYLNSLPVSSLKAKM
ncbi:transmembrane protein 53-A-like isoform X2 [Pagrus major]